MITSLSLILLETCAYSDPPLPPPKQRELNPVEIESLWRDLASDDFPQARRGMRTLAADRASVVHFLKKQLKPVPAVHARGINHLICDLDDDEFAVREKATAELARLAELAVPALQRALQDRPSLEVRRRIEDLLRAAEKRESGPERLQALRAIEVLAEIGTPEARQVLRMLADGAPESGLTGAAKSVLERTGRAP
jgi:hypothetical protein